MALLDKNIVRQMPGPNPMHKRTTNLLGGKRKPQTHGNRRATQRPIVMGGPAPYKRRGAKTTNNAEPIGCN
eukprot:4589732-Lingulodinium_polyedra.AAC.1